jgi:hypothetical protein
MRIVVSESTFSTLLKAKLLVDECWTPGFHRAVIVV